MLKKQTNSFISDYLEKSKTNTRIKSTEENDHSVGAAVFYEKVRTLLEYQDEHLIFKNAVVRIVRRYLLITPKIKSEDLSYHLCNELVWADYLTNELLTDSKKQQLSQIIKKYLVLLHYANTELYTKREIFTTSINLLACEIEELFWPKDENVLLVNYAYETINKGIDYSAISIDSEENELQLKLAIFSLLFKPDIFSLKYELIKMIIPDWSVKDPKDFIQLGKNYHTFMANLDEIINNHNRIKYLAAVKKIIAPFIVLNSSLKSGSIENDLLDSKEKVIVESMKTYHALKIEYQSRMWRGIIRSLIFIFLTKLILAFIIEIPYDIWTTGKIHYPSFLINILLPPFLMLLVGFSIKKPGKKNDRLIRKYLSEILENNKLDDFRYLIMPDQKTAGFNLFSKIYALLSLVILFLVIWLLIRLNFNIISIILFLVILSAVAFFSFRISKNSQVLFVQSKKDRTIYSLVEIFFLPFIRIGKRLSYQLAEYNPFLYALDFLVEAPLKTIIRVFRSFMRFIAIKKDEIES